MFRVCSAFVSEWDSRRGHLHSILSKSKFWCLPNPPSLNCEQTYFGSCGWQQLANLFLARDPCIKTRQGHQCPGHWLWSHPGVVEQLLWVTRMLVSGFMSPIQLHCGHLQVIPGTTPPSKELQGGPSYYFGLSGHEYYPGFSITY